MFNLFRRCRKDEISFDIVAKDGNNVEATFDFVEATFDFVERIVRLVAFGNVALTLLLVWTGLHTKTWFVALYSSSMQRHKTSCNVAVYSVVRNVKTTTCMNVLIFRLIKYLFTRTGTFQVRILSVIDTCVGGAC